MVREQPALITLDLRMPGLNGYEVLKFIRHTPEVAATKVLVISALDAPSLQRALDEGADAVLSKPFDNDELLAVVNRLIGAAAPEAA